LAIALLVAAGCTSSGSEPSADRPETATGATTPGTLATEETSPDVTTLGRIVVSNAGCIVEGIDGPLQAGPVALTIVNETDGVVVANMSRILDGGTYEQLAAHVQREVRRARAGKAGLGHPPYAAPSFDLLVDPGESDTLSGEVTAGTYAIVCGRVFDEVGELRPSAVVGPYEVS
jgi:hypothetical protein